MEVDLESEVAKGTAFLPPMFRRVEGDGVVVPKLECNASFVSPGDKTEVYLFGIPKQTGL